MRRALGQRAVMVSDEEGSHAVFGLETNSTRTSADRCSTAAAM
jgi:hypothetical protein